MSNALSSHNTLLKRGNGASPETFTAISEVVSISGINLKLETIDVTNLSSTNGWREKIAGLKDAGDVTLEINYIPDDTTQNGVAGLAADLKNKTKRNFQLVCPDSGASTYSFSAFVTAFSPNASTGDKLSASVTLTITGEPTLP